MADQEYVEYDERRGTDIPTTDYEWPWQKHQCGVCKCGFVIAASYRGFNCCPGPKCPECENKIFEKEQAWYDDGRWDEIG